MKRKPTKTRKRLKSTARSSAGGYYDEDHFGEESNMRLSRAFVVVLILHIVAVGGILLFNNMKARQDEISASTADEQTQESSPPELQSVAANTDVQTAANSAKVHVLRSGDTLSRLSRLYGVSIPELVKANGLQNTTSLQVGQRIVIPDASAPESPVIPELAGMTTKEKTGPALEKPKTKPVSSTGTPATYTVVKGDNPHAIARKFGVDYQALLEINNIKDPKLLQIGEELVIPSKR